MGVKLPALLVVLAAWPASAAARGCLKPMPATLDELRACQEKRRAEAVRAAQLKGRPLDASAFDALDDRQRAETRRFLARTNFVIEGPAPVGAAPDAAAPRAKAGKLGGATSQDLSRADPKSAAAMAALQARLQGAAGDGSRGVTPAMADDIRATLLQSQGGISPDMKDLLDAVSRDGGKLTPDTMKLLQGAGRAAKDDGLNLNIDPEIEKQLLQHDFEDDKKYYHPESSPGSL